ncbi:MULTISPECIES: peptide ABC transporter substrate-binding protein [unclassified Sporosarcina]|uniref:peptide ABC transporter substrate-binding protein n=1 Tax=unclassified Sporosarcina TaxID=2647733 RepID=UPI00203B0EAF|nr:MULTISPECIES: peptide ABC transporter substrate-binding protein [unclassified Sporosarcina]GKV67456.1 peptide ABC transporter substrate-binding protein [Sporosarcina sp. NCCP-2331]GLB57813.1 peptide ABC transporter substrate-binding protein [Sporosarcina sp. NCCP-2378]
MKKNSITLFVMLLSILMLAACVGGTDSKKETKGEQSITVNVMTEPPSLDPALATDNKSGWILDHLFEGLYMRDKDGQPVLGVAEHVDISEDRTVYTFTLRDDANWSDGSPLTAGDFEYAWKRVLNPDTGSKMAFYLYYIKNAKAYNNGEVEADEVGVEAKDDKTLVVELDSPVGYFEEMLTFWSYYPVKQDAVENNKNWSADADTYVGNGPFSLAKWKHDDSVVIEKNDEYFASDEVTLKKIEFAMVDDANTYQQMFNAGEFDMIMEVPSSMIETVKDDERFITEPYFGTYMYMFNVEKEPFTNAKIRKAFAMSLNREALTNYITKAGEQPAFAMVPPGVETESGDFRDGADPYFEEDAAKAKALMEEGMKEEGWSTLPTVELIYNTDENHKSIAEATQEMVRKNLDVEMKLVNQEWKTFLDTTAQGNYQMARLGWTGVVLDPVVMLDAYLGDSPDNETNWINEDFDRLIEEAKVEPDLDKRIKMLHEAEAILMDDMPFIPVYYYSKTYLTQDRVEDVAYYRNIYPNLKWVKVK